MKSLLLIFTLLMVFNFIPHANSEDSFYEDSFHEDSFHEESAWYHIIFSEHFQSFKNYLYIIPDALIGYYSQEPIYIRGFVVIILSLRGYLIHVKHMNVSSKYHLLMVASIFMSDILLFINDGYANWESSENKRIVKYRDKDGFVFFDITSGFFSSQHSYHNLSRELHIELSEISIAMIDTQLYALVNYQTGGLIKGKAVEISFNHELSELDFMEIACVESDDQYIKKSFTLSVFSEEVLRQIFIDINGTIENQDYEISPVRGEDFSSSMEMFVRRLETYSSSKTNTFSVCMRNAKSILFLEKEFNNSKDVLVDEVLTRSNYYMSGWLSYILILTLKQIEYFITSHLIGKISSYIFSGDCSICLNRMSFWAEVATCGRHWYCAHCLSENIRHGKTRCPLCNE